MVVFILSVGGIISLVVLALFTLGLKPFDLEVARSMAFTSFIVLEYLKIVVLRRQDRMPLFNNRWLVIALLGSLALQLIILYTPANQLFGTAPLGAVEWGIMVGSAVVSYFAAIKMTDLVIRRVGPL